MDFVSNAHVTLKSCHDKFLFHISRSCDKKVLVSTWNAEEEKIRCYSKMLPEEKKCEMLPEDLERKFGFEKPLKLTRDVWQTNLQVVPRSIRIHVTPKSVYATTTIGGQEVKLIGVHISMDFVPIGPPIVRNVLLVGYHLQERRFISEILGAECYYACVPKLFAYFLSSS